MQQITVHASEEWMRLIQEGAIASSSSRNNICKLQFKCKILLTEYYTEKI